MATVRRLMNAKKDETNYYVNCTDTIFQALQVMAQANIGAVLVKDGEHFVGIFTERDYARKGEAQGRTAKETLVKELMTEKMITVVPETTVEQCMAIMLKYRIRHLPVVEHEKLVGLVSMRDVVESVVSNKETLIKDLESYIMGTGFTG